MVSRDERFDALHEWLYRLERDLIADESSSLPAVQLQEQINNTGGRIEHMQSDVERFEQHMQAQMGAFREGTQEVLRRLAEHQVEEAERLTQLTQAHAELRETVLGGDRPTTAALVEVLETQVVLTERAQDIESRVEQGLQQLEQHLADVETRLLTLDDLRTRLVEIQNRASVDGQIVALQGAINDLEKRLRASRKPPEAEHNGAANPAPKTDDLTQIFGIGPKMADRLAREGVDDIAALAGLTADDLERLSSKIRGFKDRQARHDWVGQAKTIVERASAGAPQPAAAEPPVENGAAANDTSADLTVETPSEPSDLPGPAAASWPVPTRADPESMH